MHDLTAMAVFAAIAEAMSFSQAAERLNLSKSAVSKQLARLEERLGARLVNRTTRQISLTEVGEIYYGFCARILKDAEAADMAVAQLQAAPRGRLRVNAPMSFGTMHLAPAVASFMAEYPDIHVELELTDSFIDLIDSGFDLAIRITQMADSSLIARRLAPSRNRVMASPAYLEKFGRPEHPGDLKRHRCLIYANSSETSFWTFRQGGDSQQVAVDGPLRSNNGEILRDAAIAGAGLSIQPLFIAWQAVRRGELVPVLEDWTIRELSIQAVYPHRRHLSPKVRAFIDHLAGCFGDPPYWEG